MVKKRKRAKRKFTLPIAPIAGLAVGLAEPIQVALFQQNYDWAAKEIAARYTGFFQGGFHPELLMKGLVPLIAGGLVHKFVGGSPINLNKMLAAAGVPIIRI